LGVKKVLALRKRRLVARRMDATYAIQRMFLFYHRVWQEILWTPPISNKQTLVRHSLKR
jgi:hypothetical protein